MRSQIMVVDDEAAIRDALAEVLGEDGAEVATAANAYDALQLLSQRPPDIVLADVRMPGMDGLALLREIRTRAAQVDVVLMTAFDDMTTVAVAMREGAADFLVKPLDLHHLRRVVVRVMADRATRRQSRTSTTVPDAIAARFIGRHPLVIDTFKIVGQVAARRTNVLIRGETGTGKELLAKAIHEQSPFAAEPFVTVNCSAIPAQLLESELFGHVRGAFTGAIAARRGRFALAGKGTIFLDEIGDTSIDIQAKLLRVLQEHEFYPVGAERSERSEARVIAATHRNLEGMVANGAFRGDLYYRLRVIEITAPALRERLSDLPQLVSHLIERASATLSRPAPVLAPEAMDVIHRHPWPGNVRELEHCLRRAVILATSGVIRPQHLGLSPAPTNSPGGLKSLSELEREHVSRVLEANNGHKTRAAQVLGVSRPRLNRLLKEYGLE